MRRLFRTGVRSAPPPNQVLVVTTKRVFMWTAGIFGFHKCAINEMPDAQNRGSLSAPGISLRNSGREFAVHGRAMHADLLEHAPLHHRHHAAAAGGAGVIGAGPGRPHEAAGCHCRLRRGSLGRSSSSFSKAPADVVAQRLKPRARRVCLRCSSTVGSGRGNVLWAAFSRIVVSHHCKAGPAS